MTRGVWITSDDEWGNTLVKLASLIIRDFGERCPDVAVDCWRCKAWAAFDAVKGLAKD